MFKLLGALLGAALAVLLVLLVLQNLPDIQRYFRMRAMAS